MQRHTRTRPYVGDADKSTDLFSKRFRRFGTVMFSMENLDMDPGMNRHNMIFEAPGFAASIPPVSTSAVRSSPGSGDSSTNSIDLFLYEESSVSDESLYESDQENRELSGSCKQFKSHRRRPKCLQHQIQQRQAANMRERRRMQSINDAFEGLRAHIPTLPYEKRLSKVDTLKLAIGYINFLGELVRNDKTAKESAASGTTRTLKREEPKKIIVKGAPCRDTYDPPESSAFEVGRLQMECGSSHAHSLSWSRRGEHPHGSTLFARVWTPQDPRAPNSSSPSD